MDMAIPMKFRIYRNSEADFYHHRDLGNLDLHYSNAWFEKLLEHGFNGFWLNVWMRRLVAFRETETVEQTQRVDSLNRLGISYPLLLSHRHQSRRDGFLE